MRPDNIRGLSLTLFVLFFVCLFSTQASSETIRIGYFKLAPHTFNENNDHKGATVDFWEKHIAPSMNVDIEWVGPHPVPRLLNMLENGKLNVIALLAKNKERAEKFDYPDHPYFHSSSVIALLKERPLDTIQSMDEIAGFRFGFFAKGFRHPVVRNNSQIEWALLHSVDWLKLNLAKLVGKRIDAVYNPDFKSLIYGAQKLGFVDKIKVLNLPGTRSGMFSLFSKADRGLFLKRYNAAHGKISGNIKYGDILENYLK